MRAAIVHLSDIHFRTKGNPIVGFVDQLAHAIDSTDGNISLFLIVISGDIAFSGKTEEYKVALGFCRDLSKALRALRPGARVEFASVPGNHDCVLPQSGAKLREILIKGAIPSMQDKAQDQNVLRQLLKAQAPYSRFKDRLRRGKWNGLCETVRIEHEGKTIQLNLYNTALLSQRGESQGQLYLPVNGFDGTISPPTSSALSISVFHHSFLWLESNIAIAFRAHIENTSDIALCGHQHYSHAFAKENTSGERVLYVEAPALQDEQYAKSSGFRVMLFDWQTETEKLITFRRSRDSYRRADESDWKPLTLNRAFRPNFKPSRSFDDALNQHGIPLSHGVKGPLKLREVFVYPTLSVRAAGVKAQSRSTKEVKGEEIIEYIRKTKRVVFQGAGFGGGLAQAKTFLCSLGCPVQAPLERGFSACPAQSLEHLTPPRSPRTE